VAASVALGAAVAGQLAFLFPVVALALSGLAVVVFRDPAPLRERSRRIRDALVWLTMPGATVAAAIVAVPLSHARRSQFEFGAWALNETVRSLVDASFRHHAAPWPPVLTVGDERIVGWLIAAGVIVGAAAVVGTFAAIATRHRARDAALTPHEVVVLTGAATIALTLLMVVVARTAVNMKYPTARTALYFLPLASLTLAAAAQSLIMRSGLGRVAGAALVAGLTLAAARFALEVQTTHFYEWRFDAGSRRIYDTIARWPQRPAEGWRVGANDVYPPALNFYRVTRQDGAIQEVAWDWDGIDQDYDRGAGADYDFFVVRSGPGAERVTKVADPVYRDPISNAVLLARRSHAHR